MKRDRSRCIYCGTTEQLTPDHVPPKNIFPEPRTSDLITVPACERCNKSYGLDDEYFRAAITVAAEENPVALDLWRRKVVRGTLRRSPPLKSELLKQVKRMDVQTPAGLHIGSTHTIGFDQQRIDRVIRRIVTGLHWHERGSVPRHDLRMRAALGPDPHRPDAIERAAVELLRNRSWQTIANGIFRDAFGIASDSPECTGWVMVFYSAAVIVVTLTTDDEP